MRDLTVLVTGAGAPGFSGTLYSLKNNFDQRPVRIFGTDCNPDVYGKHLSDKFFQVPSAETDDHDFMERIFEICEEYRAIDVILPQVEAELLIFANIKDDLEEDFGIKVACSKYHHIFHSSNKVNLYEVAESLQIPVPKYSFIETWRDLVNYVKDDLKSDIFVIKRKFGSGMRGVRVIDCNSHMNLHKFLNEKPDALRMSMTELHNVLGEHFSEPMIVQEYLPGKEYSVDMLSDEKTIYQVIPRSRDIMRTGISFAGTIENHTWLQKCCCELTEKLGLTYAHGYQFKTDRTHKPRLLECNPRVQGSMVASTLAGANIIYGAVKLALDETYPVATTKWGTKFYRDWTGFGIDNEERITY